MAFIPNPNNYPQVNHKDENKRNDRADNLEWCTAKYNVLYGTRGIRAGSKRKKPVVKLTLSGEVIQKYDSAIDAEKETGIDHSHIARCCRGKLSKTGGYKWQYAS